MRGRDNCRTYRSSRPVCRQRIRMSTAARDPDSTASLRITQQERYQELRRELTRLRRKVEELEDRLTRPAWQAYPCSVENDVTGDQSEGDSLCNCFIRALGYYSAVGVYRPTLQERRREYIARSRRCHPDRVPVEDRPQASRAQALLNRAKALLIDDPLRGQIYLLTGRSKGYHRCLREQKAISWLEELSERD